MCCVVSPTVRPARVHWTKYHMKGIILMDSHFFLAIGLIMFAFSLCFWFRKEK